MPHLFLLLLEEIKMSVICLRLRDYSHIKTRLLAKCKTLDCKQQLANVIYATGVITI